MAQERLWKIVALLEVVSAVVLIVLDLFVPTLLLLPLIVLSLLARRERCGSLGFKRPRRFGSMLAFVLAAVVVWQLFTFGLTMPILNRLTGTTQDLSSFANLKGNIGQLLGLLAVSWTIAAIGEELVYRGWLPLRLRDILGTSRTGLWLTIALSSVIFGLAHLEQGVIGVILTTLDALFYHWLLRRFDGNLWASILAHGLSNTVGLAVFFFTGPLYGLW